METTENDKLFMRRAIELALMGVNENDGGPFGCVVVFHHLLLIFLG